MANKLLKAQGYRKKKRFLKKAARMTNNTSTLEKREGDESYQSLPHTFSDRSGEMSRHKLKRPPPEIGLFMECENEELNAAQKEFYGKIKKDHSDFQKKLDDYISKTKGEIIIEEGDCFLFKINHRLNKALPKKAGSLVAIENKSGQPNNRMDSQSPKTQGASSNAESKSNYRNRRSVRFSPTAPIMPTTTLAGENRGARSTRVASSTPTAAASPPSTRNITKPTTVMEDNREATAIGGLIVGKKVSSKGGYYFGDALEFMVNKSSGKTFPSFSIFAKPTLELKPSLLGQSNTERANLDVKVKGVLMLTPAKFTEWLIQQGLIRSDQLAERAGGTPIVLKLGMYSDVSKFPYSGGYVWISESAPSVIVSVFNNSIFEGSPHVPNVILKLMYHWCCQTNVSNVLQWVNVEPMFLKNVYSLLRAVCVITVHQKYGWMGGPSKKIQVGIISLDPVHSINANRPAKQDILCVFDPKRKLLRFHAVDMSVNVGKKKAVMHCLKCLPNWVHKDSIICIDGIIKQEYFILLGFTHFDNSPNSNKDILDYSRKVLPKLFQNNLSHLSRALVQQFLDELVWRERWGPISAHAFNNLIIHLSELTRPSSAKNLLKRLKHAAVHPFSLPSVIYPESELQTPDEIRVRGQKRGAEQVGSNSNKSSPAKKPYISKQEAEADFWKVCPPENISPEITDFLSETGKESVGSYYYGIINGDDSKIVDRKPAEMVLTKCCICLKPFCDNLALMKHLLLHCQIKPKIVGSLRSVHQCTKCFMGLPTASALKIHTYNMHTPPENFKDFVCQICKKMFADRVQFLYHMQRTHSANELPYFCEVCNYRSSSYEQIIEHFTHSHRTGQHIFCPCCLKAVGLFRNSVALLGNVLFYINHVQRHKRCLEAQCHRCCLSFVSIPLLQRHLERDHASFSSNPELRKTSAVGGVMMPEPGNLIKPALLPRIKKPVLKPGVLTVKPFPSPIKYNLETGLVCAECEGFLDNPDHFQGEVKCGRCKFISHCELAVREHFAIYHGAAEPLTTCPGKPIMLRSNMHCSCGFFSSSPNTLAKHLVGCGKITAYPSEAAAKLALQNESKKTTYDDEPTVLNMLGLIRKSPEPTTEAEIEQGEISFNNFKITLKSCEEPGQSNNSSTSVSSEVLAPLASDTTFETQNTVQSEENQSPNITTDAMLTDSSPQPEESSNSTQGIIATESEIQEKTDDSTNTESI